MLETILSFVLAVMPGVAFQKLLILGTGTTATAACTPPTGSTYTEVFGDASTSCWTSGPSTCTHTWTVGSGTAQSIVASPSGAPANTACSYSLSLDPSAATSYIYVSQSLPYLTTIDIYSYIYVASASGLGTFTQYDILSIATSAPTGSIRAKMSFRQDAAGVYRFRASGTASVTTGTVNLAEWHKLQLHLQDGAAASYISLDDGTGVTFTQNSNDGVYITIGNGASATWSMQLGTFYIN